MDFRTVVQHVLGPPGATTSVVECRDCGQSLEDDLARCPACGSTAISVYDLE